MSPRPGTDPLSRASHIFYVSSHGLAGDHWFDWFSKALNAHPDVYVYMGESVRAKYMKERSRKERPDLLDYTQFLIDMGAAYTAVGETYAYRSYQLERLRERYGEEVRFVNLLRHPFCWLDFYVGWRTANMNMPPENTGGVDHEWSVTCHDKFGALDLRRYERKDVEVWTSYQGMEILNRMATDENPGVVNYRLEAVVEDRRVFEEIVGYLTHGRIRFDAPLLDRVYSWVLTPFRPGGRVLTSPEAVRAAWPAWKAQAFETLVTPETVARFRRLGYTL